MGDADDTANACRNCGTLLVDKYCHACGQKRFAETDRRLAHLLGEFFRELTSIDGKLWRSLRVLLFRPGVASREYLDGRRVRYYSPIGLFVLANVLYFFAPALTDFNLPFTDQVPGRLALQTQDPAQPWSAETVAYAKSSLGQMHSRWTEPLVERTLRRKSNATGGAYMMRDLARDYDAEAGDVGKALMIVHVPILALALMLVNVHR
ncbi:MAG TPA: DUF3667 domain-containing protein, partial [Xanthomonadales bacterium]|nr:DUF3667 domain-containing protein [Xanthomonadales bacterium]